MEVLKTLYEELYNQIQLISAKPDGKKLNPVTFTAMQGHRYADSKNTSGNNFHMMLVGRAVNGWDEYRGKNSSKDDFVSASMANLENRPETLVNGGRDRFEWVETIGDTAKNTYRKGIDQDLIDSYYLSRPFWGYTKEIWDRLYGKHTLWEERWFENIIWTNLYKIAPRDGGNPPRDWLKTQENICVKLLRAEIEYFNPTHILFVTGTDWFLPFSTIFSNVKYIGINYPNGKNKNSVYAEATADYVTQSGRTCKVVVACRPEIRSKNDYVAQVSDVLK